MEVVDLYQLRLQSSVLVLCGGILTFRPPRAISLETVRRLVDEAVAQDFSCVYFTGGEPLILEDIYSMLSYSSGFLPTVLLTNGMLLDKKRMEKLCAVNNDQLVIQVSLDGAPRNITMHTADPAPGRAPLPVSVPCRLTGCRCAFPPPRPRPTRPTWMSYVPSTFPWGFPSRTILSVPLPAVAFPPRGSR